MTHRIDLSVRAEDALADLPPAAQHEVGELIAEACANRDGWPTPGGWDAAGLFGARSWITFAAYLDGIAADCGDTAI